MESIRKIRLKYYRKGESIREIARETGISRNTIRKFLRNDETNHKYQREVVYKPKLYNGWRNSIHLIGKSKI